MNASYASLSVCVRVCVWWFVCFFALFRRLFASRMEEFNANFSIYRATACGMGENRQNVRFKIPCHVMRNSWNSCWSWYSVVLCAIFLSFFFVLNYCKRTNPFHGCTSVCECLTVYEFAIDASRIIQALRQHLTVLSTKFAFFFLFFWIFSISRLGLLSQSVSEWAFEMSVCVGWILKPVIRLLQIIFISSSLFKFIFYILLLLMRLSLPLNSISRDRFVNGECAKNVVNQSSFKLKWIPRINVG